eukprot:gene26585-17174_t
MQKAIKCYRWKRLRSSEGLPHFDWKRLFIGLLKAKVERAGCQEGVGVLDAKKGLVSQSAAKDYRVMPMEEAENDNGVLDNGVLDNSSFLAAPSADLNVQGNGGYQASRRPSSTNLGNQGSNSVQF